MLKRLILISALFLWPVAGMADVQADMAIQRGPAERMTPENTVLIYVDYTTEIGRASCRERVCQYV